MAAKRMWRVRFLATVEVEVEGEYAFDARRAAAPVISLLSRGATVDDLSFLSATPFERSPLKGRERIAREAADAFLSDDDPCWSEDGTEEEQEAEEEERSAQGPLAGPAEEPEGAKGTGGEGTQGRATEGGQIPVDPFESPDPIRDEGYP